MTCDSAKASSASSSSPSLSFEAFLLRCEEEEEEEEEVKSGSINDILSSSNAKSSSRKHGRLEEGCVGLRLHAADKRCHSFCSDERFKSIRGFKSPRRRDSIESSCNSRRRLIRAFVLFVRLRTVQRNVRVRERRDSRER